jgi:hypothetical protein
MPGFSLHHDPPATGYLGFLAEELEAMGMPTKVTGRGFAASLVFDDPEVLEKYGRIYFHQPGDGRAQYIWKSGGSLGPVRDRRQQPSGSAKW